VDTVSDSGTERWWRVVARRRDYEYGAVACYEQEAEARAVAERINAARSTRLIRAGFVFIVLQDGSRQGLPLHQERILAWAERLIG
jgi:hypothetical protein